MITYWPEDQTSNCKEQLGNSKSFDLINMVLKSWVLFPLENPLEKKHFTFKATCGSPYSSAELGNGGNLRRNNTSSDTFQIIKDKRAF